MNSSRAYSAYRASRVLFVALYIIIDIVYVSLAKEAYKGVVRGIQKGQDTTFTTARLMSAIGAYSCMAIGWWFLVAPIIERTKKGMLPGFIYGLALYGVFNFTNYAMFDKYTPRIIAQDMLWGIGWVTILSVMYGVWLNTDARRNTHSHELLHK